MPLAARIIPRLDIKGPNLVKGIHLEGLRVLGKPESFARYYYAQGADELFFQDVVASLYGRNSLHEVISRTASEVFIPLTVGGGLRTLDDIAGVLRAGADKVSINTAAHETPELISKASKIFGRSTVVVTVEAIRQSDGRYEAFTDNGRNPTGRNVVDWVKDVEELGAGEILLTSVDREGTGAGPDMVLIENVCANISLPLVIHGGMGNSDHAVDVIKSFRVSGIALASMLHYDYLQNNRQVCGFEAEGNIDFLRSNRTFSKISPTTVKELKKALSRSDITCRMS